MDSELQTQNKTCSCVSFRDNAVSSLGILVFDFFDVVFFVTFVASNRVKKVDEEL